MLKLSKKFCLFSILIAIGVTPLLASSPVSAALSQNFLQVKTADSPAVYFLSHKNKRRKVYLNPIAYLNYGNKWSDIKIISSAELAQWPEAKLVRTANSPRIYFINNGQKTLIRKPADLITLGLNGEPIIEISDIDLDQYSSIQNNNYPEDDNNNNSSVVSSSLRVSSEMIQGANNNVLLTNTTGNLIGTFKLYAANDSVTVNSIIISLTGIYSGAIVKKVTIVDQSYSSYQAAVSWNSNTRQITIGFYNPLIMAAGEEKVFNVLIDLDNCSCDNQTIHAEIKNIEAINSDRTVSGNFPVVSTEFKIMSGNNYIGQVRSQEQSLATTNLIFNNGSRIIGKFNVYEDSGNEDVYLKRLVFRNQGGVSYYDWEDFRLLRDGEVIARVSEVNNQGDIAFDINYCRISSSFPAELTIVAGLQTDYNPQAQFDLSLDSIWAVGKTFNLSLFANINNLAESYTLN